MKALSVSLFFSLLRVPIILAFVNSGESIKLAYAAVAAVDLWFGLLNLVVARNYDNRGSAWLAPAWYASAMLFIPERVAIGDFAETFLIATVYAWAALKILFTFWLGRCWSPGYTNCGGRLVTSGPYGVVRHPLLALSVINRILFLLFMPTQWNLIVVVVVYLGSRVVASLEDSYQADQWGEVWQAYRRKVPGVFFPRQAIIESQENDGEADENLRMTGGLGDTPIQEKEAEAFRLGTSLELPHNGGVGVPPTDGQGDSSLLLSGLSLAEVEALERSLLVETSGQRARDDFGR